MNVRLSSCGSVSSCTDKDMRGIRLLSLSGGGSPKSQLRNKNTVFIHKVVINLLPSKDPRICSTYSIQGMWNREPLSKNEKPFA